MNESSKAARRRFVENATGVFPWAKIIRGKWLDVGAGTDLYPVGDMTGFDKEDGDANNLSTYFEPESFNGIHASQCLEHLINPTLALQDWVKLVKPKGHVIFSVPDWVLYEGLVFPSRFNPDHKSTWSMYYRKSNAPIHCYVPEFLANATPLATVLRAKLIDNNYDYKVLTSIDQTWPEDKGVEAFIEVVLQLPPKRK